MIIISAIIDFADQSTRDTTVKLLTPIQMATRKQEAGCISYCFAADPGMPTRIQVYELWADEASVAAHFKHPNYQRMLSLLLDSGIVYDENQMYRIDRHEPVYDTDGQPRERFFD